MGSSIPLRSYRETLSALATAHRVRSTMEKRCKHDLLLGSCGLCCPPPGLIRDNSWSRSDEKHLPRGLADYGQRNPSRAVPSYSGK